MNPSVVYYTKVLWPVTWLWIKSEEDGTKCTLNYGHVIIGFLQFGDQIKKHNYKIKKNQKTKPKHHPRKKLGHMIRIVKTEDQEKDNILPSFPSGKSIYSQYKLPRFKPLLNLTTGMEVEVRIFLPTF